MGADIVAALLEVAVYAAILGLAYVIGRKPPMARFISRKETRNE